MVKKTTKKTTSKSKKQVAKSKKQVTKSNPESNSFGIMALAVLGLILLLYFGSKSEVTIELEVDNNKKTEEVQTTQKNIIISGKSYTSKEEAINKLKFTPQTVLTDDEREFVESYTY